jgi:tryptophan synthase alpha chain
MNKINHLFEHKKKNILSIFVTAGFPKLGSTIEILKTLESQGVDMVEIGIPYSDPLADGPIIQQSSSIAIQNGMNLDLLFEQLQEVKSKINIPIVLMGYYNPVMQYGIEKFCMKASSVGVSGVILPDLPMHEYELKYKKYFESNNLSIIYLITPQTPIDRVKLIDSISNGFIYAVSSSSTTGSSTDFNNSQIEYLKLIKSMNLRNPVMIGFGIHNKTTLDTAWNFANGAIIGSAYLKKIMETHNIEDANRDFFEMIKN